jgi:hypothetical protein
MIFETNTNFIIKSKDNEKSNVLSLDYVKNYLKITYKEDDELLKDFIICAMVAAENFTSRSIFKKSVLVNVKNIKRNQQSKYLESENVLILEPPIKPFYSTDKKNENCCDVDFIPETGKMRVRGKLSNLSNNNEANNEMLFSYISFDFYTYEAIKMGVLMHIGTMYEFRSNSYLTKAITDIYFPYRKVFI